jgi:hypothetical protein
MGEVDEIFNSDSCNIIVVCVFISNMLTSLLFLGGLSNTRRFALVSALNEFFNIFFKILIVLSDVLCLLALKAESSLPSFLPQLFSSFLESKLGVDPVADGELECSLASALEVLEADASFVSL